MDKYFERPYFETRKSFLLNNFGLYLPQIILPYSCLTLTKSYMHQCVKYSPFEMTHQKWLRPKLDREIEKLQNIFLLERRCRFLIRERLGWLTSRIFVQGDSFNILYIFLKYAMNFITLHVICLFLLRLIITIKMKGKCVLANTWFSWTCFFRLSNISSYETCFERVLKRHASYTFKIFLVWYFLAIKML